LIRQEGIDVVHAFCRSSERVGLLATRLARYGKVLGSRRNVGYWHTRLTLWQARALQLCGAHYAANCQAAKEFSVTQEWIRPDRITVIHNPLSADRVADGFRNVPSRAALGLDPCDRVVGIVATLRPVKDYPTFLHAAQLVLREHPQTRFLVMGTPAPKMLPELQALACSLGIGQRISWLGPVPNPTSILPHCDVAALSSRSEGFSNALLEYAAVGLATVATDVGGNREIVQDGQTGFLVPPGEPASMARRLCQLLSDDSLRREFGARARRRAESEFSEQKVLDDYTALYLRLARTD
jgi:glycosyltransferase involved in cell wall biosynthesis